jgi:nitroreductase
MELGEIITSRRSIRKYLDKDVPDEVLTQAFEWARWAPSGGNFQSWKFLVVKNRDIIKRMADAVQVKVDTLTSWPEAGEYEENLERIRNNATFFRQAPVVIAALGEQYKAIIDFILSKRGEKDPFVEEMMKGRLSAPTLIQQIGGFVAHLLLIFHNMGLGACWVTASLLAKREIEEILEVPNGWDLMALIPAGYPAESPHAKPRKTVDDIMVLVK